MPKRKRKHKLDVIFGNQSEFASDFVVDLKKSKQEKIETQARQQVLEKTTKKKSRQTKLKDFQPKFEFNFKSLKELFIWPGLLFVFRAFNLFLWLVLSMVKGALDVVLVVTGKKKPTKSFKFFSSIFKKIIKKKWFTFKSKASKKLTIVSYWPDQDLKNPFKKAPVVRHKKQPISWRAWLGFVLALFILALSFKALSYYNLFNLPSLEAKIKNHSNSALENLIFASEKAKGLELAEASGYFAKAGQDFMAAQEEVEKVDSFILSLAKLSDNPKVKVASQGEKFLSAGVHAATLGEELGLALDAIFKSEDNGLSLAVEEFLNHGGLAVKAAGSLNRELSRIDSQVLPEEYQDKFFELQQTSLILGQGLSEFIDLVKGLEPFLGTKTDKRYLLIFQNNTEMRASGGFMGSFAVLDIKNGQVKNLEVPEGGTYDTEAGLTTLVKAPKPLWLVDPLWHFWDSNWWPDWKKSAKNIMWFYEKSDGSTVDGVISFTPTVLEALLEILGPVDLTEEYGVIVTAENFWETIQPIVEEKTVLIEEDGEVKEVENRQPKKIIGEMMNKLLVELPVRLDQQKFLSMIASLEESFSQKHILLYFTDEKMQAQAEKRSWAGRMKDSRHDYLSVINTNIAGQKTDRKIKQEIEHQSKVQEDGSIIDTVVVTRYHMGIKREMFTGVRNVNWMRIYVPLGSELISASGFEQPDEHYFDYPENDWLELDSLKSEYNAQVSFPSLTKMYDEDSRTVFANWSMLDPGQVEVIVLQYKLPFNLYDLEPEYSWIDKLKFKVFGQDYDLVPYSLLVQKQPGDLSTQVTSVFELDKKNYELVWGHPHNSIASETGWQNSQILDSDKYFGALWLRDIEK